MQSRSVPASNMGTTPTSRVLSNNSVYTSVSIGTTISVDSPQTSNSSFTSSQETYEAVLSIALLDYKNEPRFKIVQKAPSPVVSRNPSPSRIAPSSRLTVQEKTSKRQSWFHHSRDPESIPSGAIKKLENTLKDIALGKNNQVRDTLTKRCFLHLYNELLRPNVEFGNVEEVLVLFIASATKEINLYQDSNGSKTDVFKQADIFVSIFISILRTCKNSDDSINRLQDAMRKHPQPKASSNSLQVPNVQPTELRPTYRLSEISAAKMIGEMFSVDDIKLQQDIIRLKDVSNERILSSDLHLMSAMVKADNGAFKPQDFDRTENYIAWKKQEIDGLSTLIDSLRDGNFNTPSKEFQFIPVNTRTALYELLVRALQYENTNVSMISNSTKSLVESCCKYWRISNVSEATVLYQAAHQTILKSPDNELDPDKTESLFGILHRLTSEAENYYTWSTIDKKTWATNLSNTYIQVMTSIRTLLTAIYGNKAPALSVILGIFYDFVEPDPFYDSIIKSGLPQRWLKKLKNSILSTTESKYVEFLESVPRDNSLDLIHVIETSTQISKTIEKLQKKFPKPLLDSIYIQREAGYFFIKLYSEDIKNILGHIEHYSIQSGVEVDPSDAMEAYSSLKALRDIFNQIKPANAKFSFDLEKFFFKYFQKICDISVQKIFPVVRQSFEQDNFTPLNLDQEIGYSSSVLDIFSMINQVFSLLNKFEWGNERQLALIYTILLKTISDSIVYYAARIKILISEDLKDYPIDELVQDRRSGVWSFNGMKDAISGSSRLVAPAPYSFKAKTCVALNNLSEMQKQLNELESKLDPERIKRLALSSDTVSKKPKSNIFTVRIVRAENIKPSSSDGLSNSYVVLMDTNLGKEVGKTKIIPKTLNPIYDEEFEFEQSAGSSISLTATVWNSGSRLTSQDLLGRAVLQLDPKGFRNDGVPEEKLRDLDTQGSLIFEISLESEKDDAIYSIGRANRTIYRTMERSLALVVDKFSIFITESFSRQTLRTICGNNGLRAPNAEEAKDAIVPLFDYLNSNLQVLASTLGSDILIKVMVQAWKVILNSADTLLLPALASVKVLNLLLNNNWKNSLSNAVANVTNSVTIPGYGRSLTPAEVDTIFIWLNSLCDFFYNNGDGPSLDMLKEEHYQRLLLIQKFYDESPTYLKQEVENLTTPVRKALKARNFLGDEDDPNGELIARSQTLARTQSIAAYGSSQRRQNARKVAMESDKYSGNFQIYTEDIILRVLLSKDDREFVHRRIREREKMAQAFTTERLATLAVRGKRY